MTEQSKPIIELDTYKESMAVINLAGSNLASVNTYATGRRNKEMQLADYGAHIFNLIESVHFALEDEHGVELIMNKINDVVTLAVPTDFRPQLFERLNQLVTLLMGRYFYSRKVYDLVFRLMTVFKNHIDNEPQIDEALEAREFSELEKVVYMLGDWEDQIRFAHESDVESPA